MDQSTRSCAECGFAWDASYDDNVLMLTAAPRWFAKAFEGAAFEGAGFEGAAHTAPADDHTSAAPPAATWSPGAYLWHVVDVLRIAAERCRQLALDPGRPIVPFDQDALAAVRSYEQLSPAAGLAVLSAASTELVGQLATTPRTASAPHPQLGAFDTATIARHAAHEVVHHVLDVRLQRR